MTQESNIKIYVACLASYNNGILHGKWLDVLSEEQLWEDIEQILKTSPIPDSEEWAIHDYETPNNIRIEEYDSIKLIVSLEELIEEYGDIAALLYSDHYGDIDYIKSLIEDHYIGEYDNPLEYVEDFINSTYDIPDQLSFYIDYDKYLRDLKISDIDIYELNGKYHLFYKY